MMYLTESAGVLGSDGYLERLDHPTPWTRESLGHFRRPSRNVYTLIATHGDTSLRESPYLVSIRFDLAPAAESELRTSIRNELLPGWTALPQVGRVKLYGIDKPPSPASKRPSAASTRAGRDRNAICCSRNARNPTWPSRSDGGHGGVASRRT